MLLIMDNEIINCTYMEKKVTGVLPWEALYKLSTVQQCPLRQGLGWPSEGLLGGSAYGDSSLISGWSAWGDCQAARKGSTKTQAGDSSRSQAVHRSGDPHVRQLMARRPWYRTGRQRTQYPEENPAERYASADGFERAHTRAAGPRSTRSRKSSTGRSHCREPASRGTAEQGGSAGCSRRPRVHPPERCGPGEARRGHGPGRSQTRTKLVGRVRQVACDGGASARVTWSFDCGAKGGSPGLPLCVQSEGARLLQLLPAPRHPPRHGEP